MQKLPMGTAQKRLFFRKLSSSRKCLLCIVGSQQAFPRRAELPEKEPLLCGPHWKLLHDASTKKGEPLGDALLQKCPCAIPSHKLLFPLSMSLVSTVYLQLRLNGGNIKPTSRY